MASRTDVLAGRAAVELTLKNANFNRGLDGASRRLKSFGRDAGDLSKVIGPLRGLESVLGRFPDLFGGASAGLSLLSAGPWVAIAAAGTAVAASIYAMSQKTFVLAEAMQKAREQGDAFRKEHELMAQRLEQLAKKQNISNEESQEAARLTTQLSAAYGDLGVNLDASGKRLEVLAGFMERFSKAAKDTRVQQLDAEIAELQGNLRGLGKELDATTWKDTALRFLASTGLLGPGTVESFETAGKVFDKEKTAEIQKQLERLKEAQKAREALLQGGTTEEKLKAGDLEAKAAEAAEKARIEAEKKLAIEEQMLAIEKAKADWMEAQKKTRDAIASRDNWAALEREMGARPFEDAKARIRQSQATFNPNALMAMGRGIGNPQERAAKAAEKAVVELHDIQKINQAMLMELKANGAFVA